MAGTETKKIPGKAASGCLHIYCGNGKGKTTAALGLALRAAGRGKKVLIARFLKTDDSGEVAALKGIFGIQVMPCEKVFGFFWQMTEEEKKEAGQYYRELLCRAWQEAVRGPYHLLVLDEILAACNHGLVEEQRLISDLRTRPPGLEVVLTGRDPSKELVDLADYVSEIKKKKHPYDKGLGAREGIEY